jgi:hypothetical protein
MKCVNHPDVDAIGTCSKCGMAICPDCSIGNGTLTCKSCAIEHDLAGPEKNTSASLKPVYLDKSKDFPESPFAPCMASLIIPGLGVYMIIPDRNKLAPFLLVLVGLGIDLLFIIVALLSLTYLYFTSANFGLSDYLLLCCIPVIVPPVYHFSSLVYTYSIWRQLKQGTYKGMLF